MTIFDILFACGLCILCISLTVAIFIGAMHKKIQSANELLQTLKNTVPESAQELERLHMIQHDMQNHYLTIQHALDKGQLEDAEKYLNSLKKWIIEIDKETRHE